MPIWHLHVSAATFCPCHGDAVSGGWRGASIALFSSAMSAIQSLLRVMTLRDAEAIILEADKVPSLRRRGEIQKLAMPPLEAQLLTDFAAPLLAGRSLDDTAVSLAFHDPGGAHYRVTIERAPAGLRTVVRPGKRP